MLPIALRPAGRRALIAGGGNVALRKAGTLLAADFHVHVVAPSIDVRLLALLEAAGSFEQRDYASADLDDCLIAVAATNDRSVNARVVADARGRGVLVCDAIDPAAGDFTMPATTRVGALTFAVDSGGSSPAFSKRIVREIEQVFGSDYAAASQTVRRVRAYLKTVASERERADVLRELSALPIERLARMNPVEAEHEAEAAIARHRGDAPAPLTSSLVCASRASALAMTQTRTVAARLAERGIATTILNVTTAGDRVQDRPLSAVGTNVFVKELEVALRERRADYAVHSCKDLPARLEPDMCLAAISSREDPRDAFCSERYASFDELPSGAVVGTSSLRRRAQLHAHRPDLRYEDIRGNVDTRLRKLRDGAFDAIVVAMAGLNRLQARATYTIPLSEELVVPAAAQGALAIETRYGEERLAQLLRAAINDAETEFCITAERAALAELRAGCNAPIGIHARLREGSLIVDGAYAVAERNVVLRERLERPCRSLEDAADAGRSIAQRLAGRLIDVRMPSVILPRTQDRPSRIGGALRVRGIEVIELRAGDAGPAPVDRIPDMLLFPSSGSVDAAKAYLRQIAGLEPRPIVAAMGPQSGDAARNAGFAPDLVSADASIESFVTLVTERLNHR